MRRAERAFVSLIVVALGCGLVQASASEKHVKDVKAAQTPDMIAASALCRQLLQAGHHHDADTEPTVDPATLEADLSSLMLKSDEVLLVGRYGNPVDTYASVLSPSGDQAISYLDVRVLRTWKGLHKVSDLLTFAMPFGGVSCEAKRTGPVVGVSTRTGGWKDFEGINSDGPYVLFLRRSRGDETQIMPELRLTGGSGLQGLFVLTSPLRVDCTAIPRKYTKRCYDQLIASLAPVKIQYRRDPLKKKYGGMPASVFLREVQSLADSPRGGQSHNAQ
ncbi:MAG: hypothetical protein WA172_14730 [Terriglobales bacterium]